MPAAQQQNGRRNGFDRKQFHEILQRFNAETAEEVEAAIFEAFRIWDRLHMSFCDVVRRTYGEDERVIELNDRLGEALEEIARKDKERGKLAEQLATLRSTSAGLAAENDRLRRGARFCRGCEWLRRALAVLAGLILSGAWLRWVPARGLLFWAPALALAGAPLAGTWCRWHWLLFSRKVRWVSWKDNDFVHWWKGLP